LSAYRAKFAQLVTQRGLTVAVAESMTAGELATAIVDIPGSGDWFQGGVVAYDTETKYKILGVSRGPVVSASAAVEMACGAAALFNADIGIATTGCAGPEPMEDQPVGTLWIGFDIAGERFHRHVMVAGKHPPARRDHSIAAVFDQANTLLRELQLAGGQ
jgi:PncC family amidohydrolase